MIELRKSKERGYADHQWLKSYHSFSFADYYDPEQMGFGPLRVINEDRVAPGRGFGKHSHRDMEILSYVLTGALEHRDSMGNGSVLYPGDVQRMSAGTGVMHSEFNYSSGEPVHFLQIWIEPNTRSLPPSYEEAHFSEESKRGALRLIASPDGRGESVSIHQDVFVYATVVDGDKPLVHGLEPHRCAYVHVVKGELTVSGQRLGGGDAIKLSDADRVVIENGRGAEVVLFDLPLQKERMPSAHPMSGAQQLA